MDVHRQRRRHRWAGCGAWEAQGGRCSWRCSELAILRSTAKQPPPLCPCGWAVKIWDLRAPGCQREYESRAAVNTVVLHPNQGELISGASQALPAQLTWG